MLIVKKYNIAEIKNGFDSCVKPNPKGAIFGKKARHGYGLYDRVFDATYLLGLFEIAEKN